MRKLVLVCVLGLAAFGITGCSQSYSPLSGMLYTDINYPSYYDGVEAAGPGPRRGTAQATSILGLVATGDASIEAAAKNGGISRIHTADHKTMNLLGLYATYTTIVTGQ